MKLLRSILRTRYVFFIALFIVGLLHDACLSETRADETIGAPFGVSWGMTQNQLENQGIVLEKRLSDDALSAFKTSALPKTPSNTDFFLFVIVDNMGVQKITWVSKDINNDITGSEGKSLYSKLKGLLVKKYGNYTDSTEITGVKLYDEYDEFYQCLKYSGCGAWMSFWEGDFGGVVLELNGSQRGEGYVRIVYESPKWGNLLDDARAAKEQDDEDAF